MVRWLPLESNPDVMNKFVNNLGLRSGWKFVDVYGLDPELLALIPQPACSLLLLFPTSDKAIGIMKLFRLMYKCIIQLRLSCSKYHAFKQEQEEKVKKEGQDVDSELYFMKQTIGNACGTVAIIHSIANNLELLKLGDGFLKNFIDSTKDLSPEEKGKKLESDEDIGGAHNASAQEGQTEAPLAEEHVNLHFVALIHKDGSLYELDGRKSFPIKHGKSSPETFLQDAAEVCKTFMKRDPTEINFTVVALTKAE